MFEKIKIWFKKKVKSFVGIADTAHSKSLGLAIGVFFGLLPSIGFIASIIAAHVFRANRAGAILGCLATNTWIGFVIIVPAVKIGAFLTGQPWSEVYDQIDDLFSDFSFGKLLDVSLLKIYVPLFLGSAVIGIILAVTMYFVARLFLKMKANRAAKLNKSKSSPKAKS